MASSSLFVAARDGDVTAVRTALAAGADPNTKFKGQTPLMYACEKGRTAVVELLLGNGAKVDLVDSYNRTALHFATMCASIEICKLLVARGASVDIQSSLGGETPLDIAKMRTLLELQKIFTQAKDGVSSPTKGSGETVAVPKAGINIFARPAAAPVADRAKQDEDEAADEPILPVAMSMPRRAPVPEVDEERRNAPAPRALE